MPTTATPNPRRCPRRHRPADPCAGKPANWPFGALTEQQIRARNAFEARARQRMLAALPEALL